MQLPEHVSYLLTLLENAGFEAYVVGGCVRDFLIGREGGDIDITTDARCGEVHAVMEAAGCSVFDTGVQHGTVTVVFERYPAVEITTYRIDGPYLDGRHPEYVRFTRSLEEDLARRDFTMNAMAYNPATGLVDPYGGRLDISAGLIRCVGDPEKRFSEDALRVLRALRFSSQLGFRIEAGTSEALANQAAALKRIARERIGAELTKLICGEQVKPVLIDYKDIIGTIIPELVPEFGLNQHNHHHIYDVWGHTVVVVDTIAPEPVLRYAALLHDIGKPPTYTVDEEGYDRFPKHARVGAPIARDVCRSLRLPKEWTDEVYRLVRHHADNLQPDDANLLHAMSKLGPDTVRRLLALKRADVTGLAPKYHEALPFFDVIEGKLDELLSEHRCYSLADLALSGDDLIEAGIPRGPEIGAALKHLLDLVIDGKVVNERDALLACLQGNGMDDGDRDSG